MNSNKLALNTDKTEIMAVGASSLLRLVDSDSADNGGSNIPFKKSVKFSELKLTRLSPCRIKSAAFVVPLFLTRIKTPWVPYFKNNNPTSARLTPLL